MIQRVGQEDFIDRRLKDTRTSETTILLDPESPEFTEEFECYHNIAKDALKLAQAYQEKYYNRNHLLREFEVGDLVLVNLHSLNLLQNFKGRGRKLLPRFDGPFEVLEKISPVAYRLRLPASFQGHPVFNIAHLEYYHQQHSAGEQGGIIRPTIESA